jgi:outer membrane protein OmpU
MNNLKKLGLTALAGSLVAFSANAVEMSVSGTSEITYTTGAGNNPVTGNPYGANTSLKFSGSGNVGWADVTIVRTINDGLGSAFLSAYQTMDMGDMGTLSLDSVGGGLEGTVANDDILPTAYEEVWNGVSGSGITGAASNDTLGYSNSFGPVSMSLAYSKGGTAASGDGSGTTETVTSSTADYHFKVDGSAMGMDGLTLAYGASSTDYTAAASNDDTSRVAHVLYSTGPISAGLRMGETDSGTAGTATKNMTAVSLAFKVNDEISVSVATQDTEYDNTAGTADVTETVDAVSASYTVGAASVRAHFAESSDDAGQAGASAEYMELSLLLAF